MVRRHQGLLMMIVALAAAPACRDTPAPPPAGPVSPHAPHAVRGAPFTLTLDGTRNDDDTVTLSLVLDVSRPLAQTLELTLTPPPGATLVTGRAREVVPTRAPGRLERRFELSHVRGPVTATASQRAGDIAGAHAAVTWPPAAPGVRVVAQPIAPVRAGGVTVDRAVKRQPPPTSPAEVHR